MNELTYQIRPLTRAELRLAVEWAANEGWNPGLHDTELFYSADSEGFLGGFLGDQLIASISAVRYGEDFGFLGFYIVRPDYRGQGYGIRIWNEAMKRLAGRNIGLDGVADQQDNYKRSGFNTAYSNLRFQGELNAPAEIPAGIVPISAAAWDDLVAYDSERFFRPRPFFLTDWISAPGSTGMAAVVNGRLQGYGVIRKCCEGYKIGPLFADDPYIAENLFLALAGTTEGKTVIIDAPEPNAEAIRLALRHGLMPVFQTARMYTGPAPDIRLNTIYGVTSFELG